MDIAHWLDPAYLIEHGGVALLFAIVLLETGVFFGFFLPGDSLLFSAGLLCSLGVIDMPLPSLLAALTAASMAGTWIGFVSGKYFMQYLIRTKGLRRLNEKYLEKTRHFYHRYGTKALIIGKFFPVIRTFVPILAGLLHVSERQFFLLNAAGSGLWILTLAGAGYFLGNFFPWLVNYLWLIVPALILVTLMPFIPSVFKKTS